MSIYTIEPINRITLTINNTSIMLDREILEKHIYFKNLLSDIFYR